MEEKIFSIKEMRDVVSLVVQLFLKDKIQFLNERMRKNMYQEIYDQILNKLGIDVDSIDENTTRTKLEVRNG